MKDKVFLDTNIIVYSFDDRDIKKKKIAQHLIAHSSGDKKCVISFQVVQEFINAASKVISLSSDELYEFLFNILRPMWEVYPTIGLYMRAKSIQEDAGLSFYDSLIIASAIEASCKILYSEDLKDGQTIQGLKIVNPFK